jgi:hypothetical protein
MAVFGAIPLLVQLRECNEDAKAQVAATVSEVAIDVENAKSFAEAGSHPTSGAYAKRGYCKRKGNGRRRCEVPGR